MHVKILSAFLKLAKGENQELAKERIAICNPCEFRNGLLCGECGCFLKAKVRDEHEHCPKNLWIK